MIEYRGKNVWHNTRNGDVYRWHKHKTIHIHSVEGTEYDVIMFMEQPTRDQVVNAIKERASE